jgi:hypothetical protein
MNVLVGLPKKAANHKIGLEKVSAWLCLLHLGMRLPLQGAFSLVIGGWAVECVDWMGLGQGQPQYATFLVGLGARLHWC